MWVHYLALHLVFEHKVELTAVQLAMGILVQFEFPKPRQTPVIFPITHADVLAARKADQAKMSLRWARSAYDAWAQLREDGQYIINNNVT